MSHWFIENLKRFNRKERYWLLKASTNNAFKLSQKFRDDLKSELKFDVPSNAYVAMDYHLNWMHAALHRDAAPTTKHKNPCGRLALPESKGKGKKKLRKERIIQANQQDVDLIIAFESTEKGKELVRLVLVEAKADTSWSSEQFRHKARRLANIFGSHSRLKRGSATIQPSFVLVSPRKPTARLLKWPTAWSEHRDRSRRDRIEDIPKWYFTKSVDGVSLQDAVGRIAWIKLKEFGEIKVKRTDANGVGWKLESI